MSTGKAGDTAATADPRPSRRVATASTLRAAAHPFRLTALEYLAMCGTLTTAQAAEAFAESPEFCDFHLGALAEHDYVELVADPEGGEPQWKLKHIGMSVGHVHDDEELSLAADSVSRLLVSRWIGRIQNYVETRHCYPPQWRAATGWTGYIAYLTLDEAQEFSQDLAKLLNRYRDRLSDPASRPVDARPVEVLGFTFPIDPHRPGA